MGNHRNEKIRIVLVCLMEQQPKETIKGKTKIIFNQDKSYFHSETHTNLEKTDEKVILSIMIDEIMENSQ